MVRADRTVPESAKSRIAGSASARVASQRLCQPFDRTPIGKSGQRLANDYAKAGTPTDAVERFWNTAIRNPDKRGRSGNARRVQFTYADTT